MRDSNLLSADRGQETQNKIIGLYLYFSVNILEEFRWKIAFLLQPQP